MLGQFLRWLMGPIEPQVIIKEVIKEVPVLTNKAPVSLPETDEPQEDFSVFKVDKLRIYTYWDGSEEVRADPMTIFKKWSEKMGDLDADLRIARANIKGSEEAYDKALDKIRYIFSIKAFDGKTGLDEETTLAYVRYINDLKKNILPSATSSPTTESTPAVSSAET
jgi:hypothetical protein